MWIQNASENIYMKYNEIVFYRIYKLVKQNGSFTGSFYHAIYLFYFVCFFLFNFVLLPLVHSFVWFKVDNSIVEERKMQTARIETKWTWLKLSWNKKKCCFFALVILTLCVRLRCFEIENQEQKKEETMYTVQ